MPSFEGLFLVFLLLLLAGGALVLYAVLRQSPGASATSAQALVGRGEFAAALAAAKVGPRAEREELMAAAVAARHLLQLDRARRLLARVLAADPGDGEAWLESGLAAAYAGDPEEAAGAFARAEARRSDLAESITLHRAWLELRRGDLRAARRRFDEVEASLENKLRSDLGSGEPLFAEWFLQAAALWEAFGDQERAQWAWREGRASAPESRLPEIAGPANGSLPPVQ